MYGSRPRRAARAHPLAARPRARAAPARAFQVARRLPRMAREHAPHLTASCEVAGMLAERLGAPTVGRRACSPTCSSAGTARARSAARRVRRSRCRCGSSTSPVDAAFQRLLGGEERVVRLVRERAGHAFDPEVAACLVDGAARDPRARRAAASAWDETLACEPHPPLLLEGEALDRALAAMGNFADLDLAVPGRSLHGRGGACAAAAAQRCRIDAARRHRGPPRGARPRPRTGRRRRADLAEARAADRGRAGAGAAAPVPHRARASRARRSCPRSRRSPAAHHERLDGSGYHRGVAGARPRRCRRACSRPPTPTTR